MAYLNDASNFVGSVDTHQQGQPASFDIPDPVDDKRDIADLVDQAITRRLSKSKDYVAHMQQEVEHWKQRCEELEIELLMMENAYDPDDTDVNGINLKQWGVFDGN